MNEHQRVDQLLAGFAEGDAISSEAVQLQAALRGLGFQSDIFVPPGRVAPHVTDRCRPLSEYRGTASDTAIHHYSIASESTDCFLSSPAEKVLVYHNITPAEFFEGFDDRVAADLKRAREDLRSVAEQSGAVWADSAFNASELKGLGVERVSVFHLPFSPASLDSPPDPLILEKFSEPMTNILFVGRIAPNKCVEELILAFAWYQKSANPFSRLVLVGSDRSAPRYYAMLRMLVGELDLANVCFELFASPAGLATYYELAHVFVTPSRHEGYCLPLVEAMHKGVPVIAREAGGMPEALGGAGVLFDDMEPPELAELINRVIGDRALREEILASQKRRLEEVKGRDVTGEIKALLPALAPSPR